MSIQNNESGDKEELLTVTEMALKLIKHVASCPNCPQCSALAKEYTEYFGTIIKSINSK